MVLTTVVHLLPRVGGSSTNQAYSNQKKATVDYAQVFRRLRLDELRHGTSNTVVQTSRCTLHVRHLYPLVPATVKIHNPFNMLWNNAGPSFCHGMHGTDLQGLYIFLHVPPHPLSLHNVAIRYKQNHTAPRYT